MTADVRGAVDSTFIVPLVTNAGIAGIFCILLILGILYPKSVVDDLKEESKELKAALREERARAEAAIAAAQATRDILVALQQHASTREETQMKRRRLPATEA